MAQLLLATNNPAKVHDITSFLSDTNYTIVTLQQAKVTQVAPEDGRTFLENSTAKALFYMKQTNLPALADDGGIEIDALNGEPGVDSHRWISQDKDDSDTDLIAYTLERMTSIPPDKRGAQMHLILTLALTDGRTFSTEGIVRGIVSTHPSPYRTQGFPFRSLFFIPAINKFYDHTLMTPEEIIQYDHRRKAIELMKPILQQYL